MKLKSQEDLVYTLHLYSQALDENGRLEDAYRVKRAAEIIQGCHELVYQRNYKVKPVILKALRYGGLTVDQLMEKIRESKIIIDRRRLSTHLHKLKQRGLVINPKHGFWTLQE